MQTRLLALGKFSCGLDNHLRADRFPIQLRRILFREDFDLLAVNADGIRLGGNLVLQIAEDGVVLQQMSQRLGIGEIVDGDKLEVGVVEGGAKNVAANAAKSVDAYFNCHITS